MTTAAIRSRLLSYLAEADDKKVKAIYTLLEKEIIETERETFVLTDEQLAILDREHELHMTGQSRSYSKTEAMQMIREHRSFR
jgi:hypothetical protein